MDVSKIGDRLAGRSLRVDAGIRFSMNRENLQSELEKMKEQENCQVEALEKPVDEAIPAKTTAIYLAVRGLGCPRCALRVRNGLLSLDGVLRAVVFLKQGIAAAAYDPTRVSSDDLVMAVAAAGERSHHHYEATVLSQMPAARALLLTNTRIP